ncbi:TIGR03643 family protein [Dyadobacter sp. NIV53]|uniref:TIGR03643 family protein n=1 Tax=Dyadobacter sp. NIV53 TaxID=2861765 RepID=UPI001C87B9B4|nr:TIGR03643 family protein [Dyadobacter sp. NIV53]
MAGESIILEANDQLPALEADHLPEVKPVDFKTLSESDINRIIEMVWEDRTPFEAIEFQFGLKEPDVKSLMKQQLKFTSYKLWRTRATNVSTKHAKKRSEDINRFKSNLQRSITLNKISKR